jgi:zinc/manganese transport system ATP-binding protein
LRILEVVSPAAVFEHAGVRLGARWIWRDVDLAIDAGQFVAILGPNGAGKSTLLRAMLGVVPLAEGTVTVFGRPVRRGNPEVGYLPQRRRFDPDLRIRATDLVRLGLDGASWGVSIPFGAGERAKAAHVDEMLAVVGASAYAHRPVGDLSGGEQQRVLIAHALISGPRLLLLDEPLANLDLRSGHEVVELLARIAAEQHIAVLISAHEMNPLLGVMDRIVYLAGGRAASGTTTEVVRGDVLSRLYGYHVDVLRVHGRVLVVSGAGDAARDGEPEHPVEVLA